VGHARRLIIMLGSERWRGMMEIIAADDERREACERFSDLKWQDGGRRAQNHVDPATIYAQYAKSRARRRWAITIIAALSALSWVVLILIGIATFSTL
jgi:hypothetical protein